MYLQDLIILPDHRTAIRHKIHQILHRLKQLPLTVILPPGTHHKGDSQLSQLPDHCHIFRIDSHGPVFYKSSVYVCCDQFYHVVFTPLPSEIPISSP